MPPQQIPQQEKKINPLAIGAVIFALVLFGLGLFLIFGRSRELPPPPFDGPPVSGSTTTPVTQETVNRRIPTPPAFSEVETIEEKRVVLLSLARKSTTQKLTDEEKKFILQEFGGERTALFKFSNEELKLIVDALNR